MKFIDYRDILKETEVKKWCDVMKRHRGRPVDPPKKREEDKNEQPRQYSD